MGTPPPARQQMTSPTAPAEPVPVAFLGRTSTLVMQDPVASLRRKNRSKADVVVEPASPLEIFKIEYETVR